MPLTLLITTGGTVSVAVTAISGGGQSKINVVNTSSDKEKLAQLKVKSNLNENDVAWEYVLLLPEGKALCGVDTVENPFHFNSEMKEKHCDREWMKKHKASRIINQKFD